MGAFLGQPSKAYRNFQIAFTLLTLNFAIPAVSYVLRPEIVGAQFADIGVLLGGPRYDFPEHGSRLWRYLGAANVMTLGLMCFLLQLDLRRYRPVLVPLVFLKAYNATLFLLDWIAGTHNPAFLAVALFDYLTSAAFLFFSLRAAKDIAGRPDAELVPVPWSGRR